MKSFSLLILLVSFTMIVCTGCSSLSSEQEKQLELLRSVGPEFNNDPLTNFTTKDSCDVYTLSLDGEPSGKVVEGKIQGFAAPIKIIVGFNAKGEITGFQVLEHQETPGYGDQLQSFFENSLPGLNPTTMPLKVKQDGGDIDGITGATISSRALLSFINKASKL